MNGPVLNKLSPDTQRKVPQTTQRHCKARISVFPHLLSFSSPSTPPIRPPLPPPEERGGALPRTESSPVISRGAPGGWVGRLISGNEREAGFKHLCLLSSILFHLSFFLLLLLSSRFLHLARETSFGRHLKMLERSLCFLFLSLRRGPQRDQWGKKKKKHGLVSCDVYYVSSMWFGLLGPSVSNQASPLRRHERS